MPQLNVILHGLMAIYEETDKIRVFLPNVTNVHVFRAGNWLAETDLQPRKEPYVLTGVNVPKQPASFGSNGIANLGPVPLADAAETVTQSVLQMPRPAQIFQLRPTSVDPAKDFAGKDAGRLAGASKLPSGCVLVYDTDNVQDLSLEGHDWEPPQAPDVPFANLHVYAEEDVPANGTVEHALDAFQDTIKGLFDLDVRLVNPHTTPPFDPQTDQLPPNVDEQETDELSERLVRLGQLGEILRQQLPQVRQQPNPAAANAQPLLGPFLNRKIINSTLGSCSQVIAQGVPK